MESESHPIETKNENKQKKRGLSLFGYIVPWWAVILVILVVFYCAYEKGYLASVFGDAPKLRAGEKVIELKGPVASLESASVPEPVKRLFNGRNW